MPPSRCPTSTGRRSSRSYASWSPPRHAGRRASVPSPAERTGLARARPRERPARTRERASGSWEAPSGGVRDGARRGATALHDVGLDLEAGVEEAAANSRAATLRIVRGRERESDRRDDPGERTDVRQELAERVIGADDGHLVAVGVELIALEHRLGLHRREVESDAARRGRHLLEERGHLVAGRHEEPHHVEVALERERLGAQLIDVAASQLRLRLLIRRIERVDARFERGQRLVLRCEDVRVVESNESDGNDDEEHHRLVALILRKESHGYLTESE